VADACRAVTPALSVIIPADRWGTVRAVVERLCRQTVAGRLELVLVTPDVGTLRADMGKVPQLAAVRVIEVASINPLAAALVAGLTAATAPVVVMGETHIYPHPGWAAALLDGHAEGWAVVVPGFDNANPRGALSWSGFLADHGHWGVGMPVGEVRSFPIHNVAFRCDVLLEFGERLEQVLSPGNEMALGVRERGHRVYFQPAARIDLVNLSRLKPWLHERWLAGLLVAANRRARWSWGRRLVYTCAAPLIPFVLLARTVPAVRAAARRVRVPVGTVPMMVLGAMVHGAGEMVGYARGAGNAAARQMTEYEVHRLAYLVGRPVDSGDGDRES
jgi:hypothetical protein